MIPDLEMDYILSGWYAKGEVDGTVTLWVNGAITSKLPGVEVRRGYFGVEAEGYRVEFRNIQLNLLP
jgi:hypothetical protein